MKREILAAGLGMGLLFSSCTGEKSHENVSVNGWDVTQEADIMQHGWVRYRRETSLPPGELRNVHSYEVQTGDVCVAYDKDYSCKFSTPIYDERYDYERKEEVVAEECVQEPEFSEYTAPGVSKDEDCWNSVGPNQWLVQHPRQFMVRTLLQGDGGTYACAANVSEELYYQTAKKNTGLVAKERGKCNIKSLKYAETK